MPSFRPKSPFKKGGAGVKNGIENSAISPAESKKPSMQNQRNGRSSAPKITRKRAEQPVDTRDPIKLSRDRSNMSREGSDGAAGQPGESLELPDAEAIESMSQAEAYALASKLARHPALLSQRQSSSDPIKLSRDRSNMSREGSDGAAGHPGESLELPDAEGIKSMSKAEAYALASKLARHPALLSRQRSSSSSRPPVGDARKEEALRQAREIAARRRKQRVVTPGMLAPRPIERNSVMMRSSHATKDDGSACDSATTEDTEVVENNKRANARRRRRQKSSGVGLMSESVAFQRKPASVASGVGDGLLIDGAYIPSLDTLQSIGTWESAKEDGSIVGKQRYVHQGKAEIDSKIDSTCDRIREGDERHISQESAKQQKTDGDASTGGKGESKRRFSSLFEKRRDTSKAMNAQPAETPAKPTSEAVCDLAKPQTKVATKGSTQNLNEKKAAHLKAVSTKNVDNSSEKAQPRPAEEEGDTRSLSNDVSVVGDKSAASPEPAKQQETGDDASISTEDAPVGELLTTKKLGVSSSLLDDAKPVSLSPNPVEGQTGQPAVSSVTEMISSFFWGRPKVDEDKVIPDPTTSTAASAQSKTARDAQRQVLKSELTKNERAKDQPASISAKDPPTNGETVTAIAEPAKEVTSMDGAGNLATAKEEHSLESTETPSIVERELKNAMAESVKQKNSIKRPGNKSKIGVISLKLKQKKDAETGPPPSTSSSNDLAVTKPAETQSGSDGAKDGVKSKGFFGVKKRAVPSPFKKNKGSRTPSAATNLEFADNCVQPVEPVKISVATQCAFLENNEPKNISESADNQTSDGSGERVANSNKTSESRPLPPAADEASNVSSAEATKEESRSEPTTKTSPVSSTMNMPIESGIDKGEPRSTWSVASAVSSMFSNGGSKSKSSNVRKKTASGSEEYESVASVHDDEESLRTEVEFVMDGVSPDPNEDPEHLQTTKKSQSAALPLSINASPLVEMVSNAMPLSALSPVNKEEMEVQLQPKEDEDQHEEEVLTEINRPKPVSEGLSSRLEESANQVNQLKEELLALSQRDTEVAQVELKRKTSMIQLPGKRGGRTDGLQVSSPMPKVRPPQIMKKVHLKKKMPRVLGIRYRGDAPIPNKDEDSREDLEHIRRVEDEEGRADGANGLAAGDGSDAGEEMVQNEENRMDVMNGKSSNPKGFARNESKREATSFVKGSMKSPVMRRAPRRREEDSSSGESLAMRSTLSNADFLSVQSSITTDQEAFKCKSNKCVHDGALHGPSIIERTGSLVKNPALAVRAHSRGLTAIQREKISLERHIMQGKNAARADSRKMESWRQKVNKNYVKSYHHPRVDLDNKGGASDDQDEASSTSAKTPCQGEEDGCSTAFGSQEDEDVKETDRAEDVEETSPAVQSTIDAVPDTTLVEKTLHVPLTNNTRGMSRCGYGNVASIGESMYVDNLTSKATHKPPIQEVPVPDQRVQKVHFRGVVDRFSQTSDQATGNVSVLVEEDGDEFIVRETPPVSVVRTLAREKRVRAKVSNPPAETQLRRVASNNIATQTHIEVPRVSSELPRVTSRLATQQYAAKESSSPGTLANVFESVALCSANMCMGSSRAMLACADTCGDSPRGCSRKYEIVDETNYAALSQNTLYNTQRIGTPQADDIFRTPNTSIDDAEKVAEGIYTKALTLAIQQQLSGQLTAEEQSTRSRSRELRHRNVWEDDAGSTESGFLPASNLRQKRIEDCESIDGRCVPVSRLKPDKYGNVPMNINVRGKSRKIHDYQPTNQESPREMDEQRAQPGITKNDQVIEQLNSRIANLEEKESQYVQAPQTGDKSTKLTEHDTKRSKSPRGKDPPKRGGFRKLLKLPKISVMYEV